ncbi:MAG: hypothetical protein H0U59_01995 [Gemmatimonadaceae bacterium]|nr:hypothetical protein [Gemmatimonadaceae bacterium]
MSDRIWVSPQRTVLVTLWESGQMTVATRTDPAATWGPPSYLAEEIEASLSLAEAAGEAVQTNKGMRTSDSQS